LSIDRKTGRGVPTIEERGGIQVIARAVTILRSLQDKPEGLSLGAIAKEVGLPRSTVQRIVAALDAEKFVIAASPEGRVRLGPGLVPLAAAAKVDFNHIVRPYLQRLSDELNETVDLSILDRHVMMFAEQIVSRSHRLQAVSAVGVTFPPHCCANGKAALALLSDDDAERAVKGMLQPFTANTITTLPALRTELSRIRETGVAFDREEQTEGICAVGAAFRDPYGRILAVSVPVPAVRFYGQETELADAVRNCRARIEAALGTG
jgi:DNA-binding IclR family transcriptional regulator